MTDTSGTPAVRFELTGGVATVTLDRPQQRNALSPEVRSGLVDALERIKHDAAVRAVVLAGSGGAFCAGGDLRNIAAMPPDAAAGRQRMKDAHAWLVDLLTFDRPVVAAVDGAAFGAGFSLALAADFVVASPRARFCMSFMRVGLVPDFGAFYTLPRVVGVQRAKELMLSAREVNVEEAKQLGIVLDVVPAEQTVARAQALAASFVQASGTAVSLVKHALRAAPQADLQTMFEIEANAQALAFGTAAHREAVTRFLDKQPAAFQWPA
jgi:2-(1,2-epoxy-1,2-dihydrophenyl)acetyl-CoA isomerase